VVSIGDIVDVMENSFPRTLERLEWPRYVLCRSDFDSPWAEERGGLWYTTSPLGDGKFACWGYELIVIGHVDA